MNFILLRCSPDSLRLSAQGLAEKIGPMVFFGFLGRDQLASGQVFGRKRPNVSGLPS